MEASLSICCCNYIGAMWKSEWYVVSLKRKIIVRGDRIVGIQRGRRLIVTCLVCHLEVLELCCKAFA